MTRKTSSVSAKRAYRVPDVATAKGIALDLLREYDLDSAISFGLPEVDDRYHVWRVPLRNAKTRDQLGEVVIDARKSLIRQDKSTSKEVLEARLLGRGRRTVRRSNGQFDASLIRPQLRNTVALGNSADVPRSRTFWHRCSQEVP